MHCVCQPTVQHNKRRNEGGREIARSKCQHSRASDDYVRSIRRQTFQIIGNFFAVPGFSDTWSAGIGTYNQKIVVRLGAIIVCRYGGFSGESVLAWWALSMHAPNAKLLSRCRWPVVFSSFSPVRQPSKARGAERHVARGYKCTLSLSLVMKSFMLP